MNGDHPIVRLFEARADVPNIVGRADAMNPRSASSLRQSIGAVRGVL